MPVPGLSIPDERLWDVLNGVLPAWGLLLLAPRWRVTVPFVTLTAAFYSVVYALTLLGSINDPEMAGSSMAEMFSFNGVAAMLSKRSVVLPAWTHYVVFDLWTARWEVLDARSRGVPQVLMALPLFATLMVGPVGLLAYLVLIRPWFRAGRGGGAKEE